MGQGSALTALRNTGCALRHAHTPNPGYQNLGTVLPTQGFAWQHLLPWPSTLQSSFSRFYETCTQQAGNLDALFLDIPQASTIHHMHHTQHSARQNA
jgi:hypothetical protein